MKRNTSSLALLTILAGSGLVAHAQTYTYDDAGRLTRVAYPNGNGVAYTYDDADNMTSATPLALPPAPAGLDVTRTSPGQATLTWQAGTNGSSFVIMRQVAGTNVWTQIAVVNGNSRSFVDTTLDPSTDYLYRIAAGTGNGMSAYSDVVSPSTPASINLPVPSGGSRTVLTQGVSANIHVGYAVVPIQFGSTPYGTAVFSFRQNGAVVSEAGVPASPPTSRARIFIDYRNNVKATGNQFAGVINTNTGMALVNRGGASANINFTLRNSTGEVLASGQGSLNAGAHVAQVISQLSSFAPGFQLPSDFPTATRFGSLDIASDQPLSVMALRVTSNQRGELLFTSTPVADLEQDPASSPLYFPQFADGGGFSTDFFLLNTSNTDETGTLAVFGDDGAPLSINPVTGSSSSVFNYRIAAGGLFVLQSDGSQSNISAGSVRVVPSSGSASPVGAGVFRFAQNGVVVTESGVPSATPTTHARVYIDESGNHDTSLAIVNAGAKGNVTLQAYQTDGVTPAGNGFLSFPLNNGGHLAKTANGLIPGLPPGFTGVLDISSPTPFAALTLRALINQRGELLFSTLPIADLTRAAPAPVIFPQIADGGGFQTELILLGPASAAACKVRFFAEDGSPLAVGMLP